MKPPLRIPKPRRPVCLFDHATFAPATPLGVMHFLGDPVAIAREARGGGRAQPLVGKPMAMLLLQANATVTICHSRTEDLARHTLDADLLVAAVVPPSLSTDMVKQGATVIDVGAVAPTLGSSSGVMSRRTSPTWPPVSSSPSPAASDRGPSRPCSGTQCGLLATAAGSLRSRASELHSRALYGRRRLGARAVACLPRRKSLGSGHREVVFEREGLRISKRA